MVSTSGTISHGEAPRIDCGWPPAPKPHWSASTVNSMSQRLSNRFHTCRRSGAHAPSARHTWPSGHCAVWKQGGMRPAAVERHSPWPRARLVAVDRLSLTGTHRLCGARHPDA